MRCRSFALAPLIGLLAIFLAGATVRAGVGQAAPDQSDAATVGKKAPTFTLTSSEGKSYSLSDFAGRIVILEWANPRCPVWERVYESRIMQKSREEVKKIDDEVVWLMINSTHDTNPVENNGWIRKYGLRDPILLDSTGSVARSYDARTTPHMFVIDREGVLVYTGAIDDDPSGVRARRGEAVTNYVINAVRSVEAEKEVEPETTRPYGCRVKFGG